MRENNQILIVSKTARNQVFYSISLTFGPFCRNRIVTNELPDMAEHDQFYNPRLSIK